jgi:hypothetical protein
MSRAINKFGSEKVILSENGEPMFRRVMDRDGKVTQDFTVESKGFVKTLDVAVILKRTYFSEVDYQQHTAFFTQKYKLKMPKDRYLEFVYFKYDPKAMESVCVRNFDTGVTFSINVMSPENQKEYGIKPVGKPVKISANKASVMLREKEVLGLFSDKGENIVIV